MHLQADVNKVKSQFFISNVTKVLYCYVTLYPEQLAPPCLITFSKKTEEKKKKQIRMESPNQFSKILWLGLPIP